MELIQLNRANTNEEPGDQKGSIKQFEAIHNNSILPAPGLNENTAMVKTSPFIEANTEAVTLQHLKENCVIPVFTKDNEITISHQEFIDAALVSVMQAFPNELIQEPEIRVSHQIKGRAPGALHIAAKDLEEHQRTSYFERMAFIIRIPGVCEDINGNKLSLVVGGVRAYNLENLYNKKTFEKFKVFIGFQNMVCCNLCVRTDGYSSEIKAMSIYDLQDKILRLIQNYNSNQHISEMSNLVHQSLSEREFAQIIGKCRLYNYLPKHDKIEIPELLLTDGHIATVAKEYYQDESFSRDEDGNINIWNFYNLLTGSNKSSYIDTLVARGVNAFDFSIGIAKALSDRNSKYAWFLS